MHTEAFFKKKSKMVIYHLFFFILSVTIKYASDCTDSKWLLIKYKLNSLDSDIYSKQHGMEFL